MVAQKRWVVNSLRIRPWFSPNPEVRRVRPKLPQPSIVGRVISVLPLASADPCESTHRRPSTHQPSTMPQLRCVLRPPDPRDDPRAFAPVSAWPSMLALRRGDECAFRRHLIRGGARAVPPRATARDSHARRAPYPHDFYVAPALGRRAFVESPDTPPIEPRLASDRRVASPLSSFADPSAFGRGPRSTDARIPASGETSAIARSPSFVLRSKKPHLPFDCAAFTSPRATSRSSTRSSTTSSDPAAG